MYPSSIAKTRSDRVPVEIDPGAMYAGTQFRAFYEITLAAGATLNIRMTRGVDIVLRSFTMHVNTGEMRCEIYRSATTGGTWSPISIIPCNEFSDRPAPIYTTRCQLEYGGTFTGGTLYDLMHVKTAGATAQSSTVGDEMNAVLGIPNGSVSHYKFSNPGNSDSKCVFAIRWEELPIK